MSGHYARPIYQESQATWPHYLMALFLFLGFVFLRTGQGNSPPPNPTDNMELMPAADSAFNDTTAPEEDSIAISVNRLGLYCYHGARVRIVGSTRKWFRLASSEAKEPLIQYYSRMLGTPEQFATGAWLFARGAHPSDPHVSVEDMGTERTIDVWWPS